MTSDQMRTILERLAVGELSSSEAEERLRAIDDEAADAETQAQPTTILHEPSAAPRRVRARLNGGGLIEVVGDDDAQSVRVDGPNTCVVADDATVTTVAGDVGDDTAVIVPSDVDLEVEMNGGNAVIRNVLGSVQAQVNAAALRWEGAALRRGKSTLYANVGDVDLTLTRDADVRITVRCVASVNVDPRLEKISRGVWQLGEGNAELEIDGHLGEVKVSIAP